jgi:hypothetical protein
MTKFVAGVIVGLFLGTATTVYGTVATGPQTSSGWIAIKDGEAVRSDPSVTAPTNQIDRD